MSFLVQCVLKGIISLVKLIHADTNVTVEVAKYVTLNLGFVRHTLVKEAGLDRAASFKVTETTGRNVL